MTFVMWVPLRRGIFEHLMDGRLSNHEGLVLILLIGLADHKNGAGRINAPALLTYLPELSYHAAKRTLHSLQEKGIFSGRSSSNPSGFIDIGSINTNHPKGRSSRARRISRKPL